MNTPAQIDIEKNKEKLELKNFVIDLILRVIGIFLWFYIWFNFIWFLDYEKDIIQILIPMALGVGFIAILSPRLIFGIKYWRYVISIFYILSCSAILLR